MAWRRNISTNYKQILIQIILFDKKINETLKTVKIWYFGWTLDLLWCYKPNRCWHLNGYRWIPMEMATSIERIMIHYLIELPRTFNLWIWTKTPKMVISLWLNLKLNQISIKCVAWAHEIHQTISIPFRLWNVKWHNAPLPAIYQQIHMWNVNQTLQSTRKTKKTFLSKTNKIPFYLYCSDFVVAKKKFSPSKWTDLWLFVHFFGQLPNQTVSIFFENVQLKQ